MPAGHKGIACPIPLIQGQITLRYNFDFIEITQGERFLLFISLALELKLSLFFTQASFSTSPGKKRAANFQTRASAKGVLFFSFTFCFTLSFFLKKFLSVYNVYTL